MEHLAAQGMLLGCSWWLPYKVPPYKVGRYVRYLKFACMTWSVMTECSVEIYLNSKVPLANNVPILTQHYDGIVPRALFATVEKLRRGGGGRIEGPHLFANQNCRGHSSRKRTKN